MKKTLLDTEDHSLLTNDSDWQVIESGEDGVILRRSYRFRVTEVFLKPIDATALRLFTTDVKELQIPLDESMILSVHEQPALLTEGADFYWVEMRHNGNIVVDDNGNVVSYFIGIVLNPHSAGKCIYVVTTITCNMLSYEKIATYENEVKHLLGEIHCKIPKTQADPMIHAYRAPSNRTKLSHTKLHYIETYSSGDYAGGGGYSTEEVIELHGNGTFHYEYQSITNAPSFDGFSLGSSCKTDRGSGSWHADDDTLHLRFQDGRHREWSYQLIAECVLMDGKSYDWSRLG